MKHCVRTAATMVLLREHGVNSFAGLSQLHRLNGMTTTFQSRGVGLFMTATTLEQEDNVTSKIPPPSSSTTFSPDVKAYANGYKTVFEEVPCAEYSPSFGKLPSDLMGTYYRCGPAMFSAGSIVPPKASIVQPKSPPVPDGQDADRMVKHPFEADGGVLAVTFTGNGTVTARYRYVRTNAFTNERKKGKRVYNGMDSTRSSIDKLGNDLLTPLFRHHLQPGLNKKRKNTSNTRVVYWGNRLLSLWEGGLPYKLDALALSTEGRSQLGGIIKEQSPFGGSCAYDSKKNRMLFYSNVQDVKSSQLTVLEFNDKFRLVPGGMVTITLPGFAMISDIAVTEHYSIVVQPPVTVNAMQYLTSKEPGKTLSIEKGQSLLHLVPRAGTNMKNEKSLQIPFDGDVDAELQFINAYEDGSKIVLDAVRPTAAGSITSSDGGISAPSWPWALSLKEYSAMSTKKSLWRYTVDLNSGTVTKSALTDLQTCLAVVNPAVSGQRHQFIYSTVGGQGSDVAPPQGLLKLDCETMETQVWMPNEYEFCGEPMYAPKTIQDGDTLDKSEDDGYIVSVLFNGQTEQSEVVVLLANNLAAGPISRIPLTDVTVPHALFGFFDSSAVWTSEEIERRAKLAEKMESRGNMWNEVKSDFSGLGLRLDDIEEYFGDFFG